MSYRRFMSVVLQTSAVFIMSFYSINTYAVVANMSQPVVEVPADNGADEEGSNDNGPAQSALNGSVEEIADAVQGKINEDKNLRSLNLKAKVTGVDITLQGVAISQTSVDAAIAAAKMIPGVNSVTSKIIVKQNQ